MEVLEVLVDKVIPIRNVVRDVSGVKVNLPRVIFIKLVAQKRYKVKSAEALFTNAATLLAACVKMTTLQFPQYLRELQRVVAENPWLLSPLERVAMEIEKNGVVVGGHELLKFLLSFSLSSEQEQEEEDLEEIP